MHMCPTATSVCMFFADLHTLAVGTSVVSSAVQGDSVLDITPTEVSITVNLETLYAMWVKKNTYVCEALLIEVLAHKISKNLNSYYIVLKFYLYCIMHVPIIYQECVSKMLLEYITGKFGSSLQLYQF